MVQLAPYQHSVIIGLILSDGWIIFASKNNKNARLGFKQSADHASYVFFVFNILSHYCSSSPHGTTGIKAGKPYYGLEFFTRSMPCITELHSLFYLNGVKLVPQNIYELLTPVALAHMVMGDGSEKSHGLIICTNSYSVQDVIRLMNVLIIRYRLDCNLRLKTRQNKKIEYMIYVRQRSMPLLFNIVSSYMHPSMVYKLKSSLYNPSNRKKISVFDNEKNETTSYDSISEAARTLNIPKSVINLYFIRNQVKPYKGIYTFKKI